MSGEISKYVYLEIVSILKPKNSFDKKREFLNMIDSLDCDPARDVGGGELHHQARRRDRQHPLCLRLIAGVGRKCRDLKMMQG